ncbi:BclA C-terminal domain-containing protein [Psychrobacillus sp. L3]|uniref:BclA C-terminal domain-containing protein n=1 Tax=Psychrobacillus sp. L3 TaxID=3236891 RepID=UPI0036F3D4F4
MGIITPCNCLSELAYIYNLDAQTVAIEADVNFDTNGFLTAGILHATGSPSIQITNAGIYEVTFSVSGTEPNQFALFLNGDLVPGTIYASGAGTQETNGQAIFIIGAGDVLTLRNHSSAAAVGLATPIGGTQANVNASIVIKKLD